MKDSVSIIVPVFNEEKVIVDLQNRLEPLLCECEIIFVDGQSTDRTCELVRKPFRLVHSDKGRAVQMNEGAQASTGDILLFLHADSVLPSNAVQEMLDVMARSDAGCFGVRFPKGNFFMLTNRVASNLRASVRGVAFGDQGIFIRRQLFFEVGMFPEIPLMEDYQFSLNLRKRGVGFVLTKSRILTSDRRYPQGTISKLLLMRRMHVLRAQYRMGVTPEELLKRYPDIR